MIQGELGMISGIRVISNPHLPRFKLVQFRFPKTKKKRTQKKWAKDQKNFKQVEAHTAYMVGNTAILHPDDIARLENFTVKEDRYRFEHGYNLKNNLGIFRNDLIA